VEPSTRKNTWERVLDRIQCKINPRAFTTWLKPTQLASESDEVLSVRVPTSWHAEWLTNNFGRVVEESLRELGRPHLQVRYCVGGEALTSAPVGDPEARSPVPRGGNGDQHGPQLEDTGRLNPRYRFESFVVSSCNQFAHAASLAVAERPGGAYNPLYIYGGVGLGKTHLLQAIGHRLGSKVRRIEYISAERFVNDLINSIRFERTLEFRKRYRDVDLLLVDDIQFLAGKERTQEEFFHTFNTLYELRRQIVITCDCPPREIPTLQERLRSRFEWGLIADIQPPDFETKVAILRKKAEEHGVDLPADVALFVASNTGPNIRELEGALLKLVMQGSISRAPISLEMARESLKDLVAPQPSLVTIEAIQKLVANHYNLKVADLKSASHSPQVVLPRQVAMYLSKQLTRASLPEIGRKFGGKHHSTVIHAIQRIESKRSKEKDFDRLLDGLADSLR